MRAARRVRAYGLFEVRDGKHVRIHEGIFGSKDYMVKVCQNALLAYYFGESKYPRELRPIGHLDEVRREYWKSKGVLIN